MKDAMKKWIVILSAVLAVQLGLALVVNLNRQTYGTFKASEPLLHFDKAKVDKIDIAGEKGASVELVKAKGKWTLPKLGGFAADQNSVNTLLDRLAGLRKGWPVATTSSAARRFKVAADDFERRVTLKQGDKAVAQLLVGTAPGFRKVNVRTPERDDIYSVELSTFEIGTTPESWMDKSVFVMKADDIAKLAMPGFTLERNDKKLQLAGLAAGESINEDAAKHLIEQVAGLTVKGVLGTKDKPEYGMDKPSLVFTVTPIKGKPRQYTFSKPAKADHWVLKASDRPEYFSVEDWLVQPLKDATRAKLVKSKPAAPAKSAHAETATPAPEKAPVPAKAPVSAAAALPASPAKPAVPSAPAAPAAPAVPPAPKTP